MNRRSLVLPVAIAVVVISVLTGSGHAHGCIPSCISGEVSVELNLGDYGLEVISKAAYASAGMASEVPCDNWPVWIEDDFEFSSSYAEAYVPHNNWEIPEYWVYVNASAGSGGYTLYGEICGNECCCDGEWGWREVDGVLSYGWICHSYSYNSGGAFGFSGTAYRVRAIGNSGLRSTPWSAEITASLELADEGSKVVLRDVSIIGDPSGTAVVIYGVTASGNAVYSAGCAEQDGMWICTAEITGGEGEYDLGARRIKYNDETMDLDGDGRFNQLDVDILANSLGLACDPIGLCSFDFDLSDDVNAFDVAFLQLLVDQGLHSGVFADLDGDDSIDCDVLDVFDSYINISDPITLGDPNYRIELDYDLDGVIEPEDKDAVLDCNNNSVVDQCDISGGTSTDLNLNEIPDECDDCNENGVRDDLDIAGSTSDDCDGNYIPDECEGDCNENQIWDSCEIFFMTSDDCNTNGIPDECEDGDLDHNGTLDVCQTDCNNNGSPDEWEFDACDVARPEPGCSNACIETCVCAMRESCCTTEWDAQCAWGANALCFGCPLATDANSNGIPDDCDPDCDQNDIPDFLELTPLVALSESFDSLAAWEDYDPAYVSIESGPFDGYALSIKTAKQLVRGVTLKLADSVDLSDAGYAAITFDWEHVAHGAGWGQSYCPAKIKVSYLDGSDWVVFAETENGGGTAFESEIPLNAFDTQFVVKLEAEIDWNPGCYPGDETTAMWIDNLQIQTAVHADCDGNSIPDACDLQEGRQTDCNMNGVPDGCDIEQLVSHDGDQNGIPDECEHIIFVKQDATGANDGTSWDDAFNDLQDALAAARVDVAGPQNVWAIWVAQGTYKPTDTTDRTASFVIDFSFIPVYGGFAGNETQERQRNWKDNPTVLNGKILEGLGDHTHSYHVVEVDGHAFIDGFVIEYGVARSGTEDAQELGGGVYCHPHSILDIRHSVIRNNAAIHGGAIYAGDAFVLMNNCLVYYNYATLYGGAIYSAGPFMLPFPSSITRTRVINSTIAGNRAIEGGGGIYHTDGDAYVLASIIVENTSGPLEALQHDEITLGQCTRASLIWVDPVHVQTATPLPCTMTIEYSDLGYAYQGPPAIVDEDPSDPLVIDIRNGVISENPRFINAGIEEFQLRQDSPCVDSGVTAMGNLLDRDLDGNPRLMFGRDSGHLDMGAYEYNPNVLWTRDCNLNTVADNDDIANGTSLDCDINGLPDECECDCNSNGHPDLCDITQATSQDCNGNSIPDECEPDCNNNGTADSCDIDNELSSDVNWNGIPDECDPDCNTNSIPDDRDFAMGVSQDCNESNIPDECEIATGASSDCNLNGIPDECDVADGTSADTNNNGTPDECEDAPPELTTAVSEKIHGTGLTAVTRGIAEGGVECRRDGITTVKLSFDKRAKASDGTALSVSDFELSRGTVTNVTGMWLLQPPYSGSVTLSISGVDTPGLLTIAFTAENTVGVEDNYNVCWTYVPGDIDADGDVDDDDLKAMQDVYKLPRGSSTFRYDLDLDNVIEANPGEDDYLTLSSSNPTAQQTMCND